MKQWRWLLLWVAALGVMLLTPAIQAQQGPVRGSSGAVIERRGQAFTYELLNQKVNLWSDGRGDVILERRLHNVDTPAWNSTTWYFDWWPGVYTNLRAWDAEGPLQFSTTTSGTRITVTVHFRETVPIGSSYQFSLAITIAEMAYGEDNTWYAYWYTTMGAPVEEFIQGVTFPANAGFESIYPPPTVQENNYLEWRETDTPGGYVHEIDVAYVLADTIDVPLFLQSNVVLAAPPAPWAADTYGNYDVGDTYNTISQWGCKMVSAAMIINYWAEQYQEPFRTSPRDLNDWLRGQRGYDADNGVIDSQVVAYAQAHDIPLANPGYKETRNDDVLDVYLRSGNPVILGVPDHFVVATGKTTVDGVATYAINDPIYGQTTLYERYDNTYSTIRLYMGAPAEMRSLRISAHSPVELVVIDPLGRRAGHDPSTGQSWDEIPEADYIIERIAAGGDPTRGEWIESKMVMIYAPLDGQYTVRVHGTGQGEYKINTFAADWQGGVTSQVRLGQAQVGSVDEIALDYSGTNGIPETYRYLYLPTVMDR